MHENGKLFMNIPVTPEALGLDIISLGCCVSWHDHKKSPRPIFHELYHFGPDRVKIRIVS